MKHRIHESLDDFIKEGYEYIPLHPKNKSKMERKLLSSNDLRVGDIYMLVDKGTNSSVWTDGWEYKEQFKENNKDFYKFVSTNNLYDKKETVIASDDLEQLIFDKKIAKQK
jgi:hypothetical protein